MNNLSKLTEAIDFAAIRHRNQRRMGKQKEPYINHPIAVMNLLATLGEVTDLDILIAAVLHDTVEDTETTNEEISGRFGEHVAGIVAEVTDDMNLPKAERKRLQIVHAGEISEEAKLVKLADKISNVSDIRDNPPEDWSEERRRQYAKWSIEVINALRGVNKTLEDYFDAVAESVINRH